MNIHTLCVGKGYVNIAQQKYDEARAIIINFFIWL